MIKFLLVAGVILVATAVNAGRDSDFVCSELGRFKDSSDNTCKGYHLCSAGKDGKWVDIKLFCPIDTIFDESLGHCSSSATCRATGESSDVASYEDDEFICKKAGLHDDPRDPFCSKYYHCQQTHKGLFPVQYPCPQYHRFDPVAKHCSVHYACPRQFECSQHGRFEDGTDDNNKRYFLCQEDRKGKFFKTVYTCPIYTRFVQDYEVCTEADDSASDEENTHEHHLPEEAWANLDRFTCTSRGYAANKSDKNSRTYYYCDVNSDGKFYQNILTCSRNYVFNERTNLCDIYRP